MTSTVKVAVAQPGSITLMPGFNNPFESGEFFERHPISPPAPIPPPTPPPPPICAEFYHAEGGKCVKDPPRTFQVEITSVQVNDDLDPFTPGEWHLSALVNEQLIARLDDRSGTMGDVDSGTLVRFAPPFTATVTVPPDGSIFVAAFGSEEDGCAPPIPSVPDWIKEAAAKGPIASGNEEYTKYIEYVTYIEKISNGFACAFDPNDDLGTILEEFKAAPGFGVPGGYSIDHSTSSNTGNYTLNYRITEIP
jgi:hypothetical protein